MTIQKKEKRGRKAIKIDLEKIERLAAQGLTQVQIALCLGIHPVTLACKKRQSKEFRDALERGKSKGLAVITNALFEKAKGGDTTAMIWYEKTRGGYSEISKHEHSGPGGEPIKIEVEFVEPGSPESRIS